MNRRQFLTALPGTVLIAREFLKGDFPTLAPTLGPPYYATLHSTVDGEVARVRLSNPHRCEFICVTGHTFDQVRLLDANGRVLWVNEVGRVTPNGGDVIIDLGHTEFTA